MFDILFNRPTVIERYQSALLLKERLAYLKHCKEIGIKPDGVVAVLPLQHRDVPLWIC